MSLVIALGLPASILGGFAISSAHETKELQRIESQIEDYYASGDYDMALFKANQLVYDNAWGSSEAWDKKREAWIELIEKAIEKENKSAN